MARVAVSSALDPEYYDLPQLRIRLYTSHSTYGTECVGLTAHHAGSNETVPNIPPNNDEDRPSFYLAFFYPPDDMGTDSNTQIKASIDYVQYPSDDYTSFKIHSFKLFRFDPTNLLHIPQ